MASKKRSKTTVETTYEYVIADKDLEDIFRAHCEIPETVKEVFVTVGVPGGGDWSNCDLELGVGGHPVRVYWKETKTHES